TGKSFTQAPAAQADSSNSSEDDLRTFSSPHRRLLRARRASTSTQSPSAAFAFRLRRNHSIVPADLLHAEEAGLSSVRVRLSSTEMQRRYHSAFSQGKRTEEVDEMQKAHLEVDLGPESAEAEQVRTTGRRASISERPSSPVYAPSQKRELHTSTRVEEATPASTAVDPTASSSAPDASISPAQPTTTTETASTPFTTAPPPSPSIPSQRRNSISSMPFPVPLGEETFSQPKVTRVTERRPPTSSPRGRSSGRRSSKPESQTPPNRSRTRDDPGQMPPEARARYAEIKAAEQTRQPSLVEAAVRSYLAEPSSWRTETHNLALGALYRTRLPDSPLDTIVTLYNQLFEHEHLRPNLASYEHVLQAFCARDEEVRYNIRYLQKRIKKKELASAARGAWDSRASSSSSSSKITPIEGAEAEDAPEADDSMVMFDRERQRLEALRTPDFDYFTPAIQIYRALGTFADRLPSRVVTKLLDAAVARQEVDLALALFERLEKSPTQAPGARAYQALIEMYGSVEKDKDLVQEVFDSYLAGRASGKVDSSSTPPRGPKFRTRSIKHAYDSAPEYVAVDASTRTIEPMSGDDAVWGATVQALFNAGDAAGAVALLERLLTAQNAPEPLPAGYPDSLHPRLVTAVTTGFIRAGDEVSAKRWFDRLAHPQDPSNAQLPLFAFYSSALYEAIDTPFHDFVNHVYRSMLERASTAFRLAIGDFFAVIDYNLARAWKADSVEERNHLLSTVCEFRAAFEAATKQGFLDSADRVNYTLSTGLLGRICQVLGYHGRFDDATKTFVELANLVRGIIARAPAERKNAGVRSRRDWVVRFVSVASGTLGLRPSPSLPGPNSTPTSTDFVSPEARPTLKQAAIVVGWTNKLRHVVDWSPFNEHMPVVVECYLRDRNLVHQNKMHLSGDQWYTVLEAFAHTQALVKKGLRVDFDFPGFESAFHDFVSTGAKIPQGFETYDYAGFVQALKTGGIPRAKIVEVVETMNQGLIEGVRADQEPVEAVEQAIAQTTSPVSASAESVPTATSATEMSSVQGDEEPSLVRASLPTPPSTPPTYFAELTPAPPAAPSFESDQFHEALSRNIDALVADQKNLEACNLVLQSAQQGQFASVGTYGRLINQLGRQNLVNEVRQVYLVAYSALQALGNDPEAQSLAWVSLEDNMIIALAQAGQLVDVGHHRDRLLQAGCAPSADGYAAMILNMKETTDDAAVALMLFEESQRLNVRPNVYLFNTLISKLSRARRAKEALEYFELMKTYGIRPTSITYGAIINACCKTGDDVAADYLFNEMISLSDFKPRVPPYNTMIQFYTSTKPDRERALFYYNELVKANVQPTGHTFKLLLDAYGSIGEPDLEQMQHVFGRLARHKRVSVSGAHWASMIHAYGTVAKDLDRAIALFDSIPHHPTTRNNPNGPLPDAVVYEALLNAILANGKPEMCEKYLAEMKQKGVRMTAYVANTLIKGYAAQNNFAAARAIFYAMQDAPVGVASYGNHAVDRHPKHQQPFVPAPADAPVYREPSTYEMMVKVELKAGDAHAASRIVKMAEARAFPPAVINRLHHILTEAGAVSLL
ncbi:hypothetical protein JCM10212_004253, partial [Sporobolomyces blumeae]